MKSLFLRIFLSFWAAQALFIVLAILVTIAMRPARRGIENRESEILAETVNAYQSGGERAAHEYLEGLWHSDHVRAFVFDAGGKELTGHQHVPPWIEETRRGTSSRRGWLDGLLPDRIKRQALTLDGKRYTLVIELPPGPRVFFGPMHEFPGLGDLDRSDLVGAGVLSAGALDDESGNAAAQCGPEPGGREPESRERGRRTGGPRGEMVELMRDFDVMAERLEVLVDSQSRLLKDVSHELRSPLARLSVALGLARQKATPEIEGSLNRIELEADRLNQLIQRLLTISRLESGADGLRKSSLSLRELAEQVCHDAEYESAGRHCRVVTEGEDEFLVEGDPDLLRSAVENVIRNATRYTAEGTTVEVKLERQDGPSGGEMVIHVSDSGPGVPQEALAKIFEPFYRLDDARNRQTGGAGLGLSIADRAIRLHGGQVRASNRKEGGLEVQIRIPTAAGLPSETGKSGRSGDPGFALPAHS